MFRVFKKTTQAVDSYGEPGANTLIIYPNTNAGKTAILQLLLFEKQNQSIDENRIFTILFGLVCRLSTKTRKLASKSSQQTTISVTSQTRSGARWRQQCDSSAGQARRLGQGSALCQYEAGPGRSGLGLRIAARRGRLAAMRRCYHDNITIIRTP